MAVDTKVPEIDTPERVPQIDVPERLRPNFFPFNRADWLSTVAALSLLLIVNSLYSRIAALIVMGGWLLWMWPRNYGRTYELIGQWFLNQWIRRAKGGVILDAETTSRLDAIWESRPPVPVGIQAIGEIGVLHNRRAVTDSIVAVGSGSGLASLPILVQYQILERFADGIRKLSALEWRSVELSCVFRRRPADVERVRSVYEAILHPQVREAGTDVSLNGNHSAADQRNQRLNMVAEQSMGMIREHAGDVTMAVVLTVPQQEQLRKVRKRNRRGRQRTLTSREHRRLVINKVAKMAVEVLQSCNIDDPKVLDMREAHKFLHDAWEADVGRSNDYRRWLFDSTIEEVGQSLSHSPRLIVAQRDHSTTDTTHHTVVRITGAPPKESDDFFPQLHAADVPWLTVTLLGKVKKTSLEYNWLDRLIPGREVFREDVLGIIREGPKARKKAEDLEKRQELIFQSRVSQSYNLLVVVSNTDLEELQDGVDEVLRVARSMGLDAEPVRGESRQVPAHWSATTGVDML